jgi:transaldolase / glucose-6-phosphate isomerase
VGRGDRRARERGQPVVRISIAGVENLGEELFRWEIAQAMAGSILGINPFDQPDVEASKVKTRKWTDEVERTGRLPEESPFFEGDGLRLFADERNRARLGAHDSVVSYLHEHLERIEAGDYFAILAYVERSERNEEILQGMRHRVRDQKRVATCLGFGPRFLHSTGQAYKGGPPTGVFLRVTCDDDKDLAVPGRRYTFGTVKAAQARGDLDVLTERGRGAVRVHLGPGVAEGLRRLGKLVADAVGG